MKIGIIGGTGFYEAGLFNEEKDLTTSTPYGAVSLKTGAYQGREVVFLPRHGARHTVPPHLVNYRANIWALREIGAEKVIATAAVGSLQKDLKPGEIVLVDQFLDFTKSRVQTFFEGNGDGVLHVDVTTPYCPSLREEICQSAGRIQVRLHNGGTYVCTEGPRYETPAEIRMFRSLGGDVIGMTSVPEVVLAREAALCYATIALVTNFAAGISTRPLSHHEVVAAMDKAQGVLRRIIFSVLENVSESRPCSCSQAARELGSLE
ncbi:MAG: S-methyl-5'-thioadenosine phosphorylase [Thermacetogeniaceae bacterium]|jgi:5'-methylthioadenosine phosphorylase